MTCISVSKIKVEDINELLALLYTWTLKTVKQNGDRHTKCMFALLRYDTILSSDCLLLQLFKNQAPSGMEKIEPFPLCAILHCLLSDWPVITLNLSHLKPGWGSEKVNLHRNYWGLHSRLEGQESVRERHINTFRCLL